MALSRTLSQRLYDELLEYLRAAGCEARIMKIDALTGTVLLRGDYADLLLARKPCTKVGLRIIREED